MDLKILRKGINYFKKLFTLTAFLFLSYNASAQQDILTAGIEFKRFIPLQILDIEATEVRDENNNFLAVYDPAGGYGIGMVIRYGFTPIWSLETGISLNNRKYKFTINDLDSAFSDTREFKVVGYEIPLKALAYIQFADNLFMNAAFGISTDFIASDVESLGMNYSQRSFKKSWIQMALIANLGMEYRTEENGYFYLGASYHSPFSDIMISQVNYYRDKFWVGFANTNLRGNYFSVDFRYFFQPRKNTTIRKRPPPVDQW